MRKVLVYITLIVVSLLFVEIYYFTKVTAPKENPAENTDMQRLEMELQRARTELQEMKQQAEQAETAETDVSIAVVVIACKRANYLERALESVFEHMPKNNTLAGIRFVPIVSWDCKETEDMVKLLSTEENRKRLVLLRHLPRSGKMYQAYDLIAQHYRDMFHTVFEEMRFDAAILLEEDMEVSPDFFEYFAAGYKLMQMDPTLWCVSSWNDNGMDGLVNDSFALRRTQFFPGLGWMMKRETWTTDLYSKFPDSFWDEFMRDPKIRKDRECIIPEVSRTQNFGEEGVSVGEFFRDYISRIHKNNVTIEWTKMDLANVTKQPYHESFKKYFESLTETTIKAVLDGTEKNSAVKIMYERTETGYSQVANKFKLMTNMKEGYPRGTYQGVLTFRWNNYYHVHLYPHDLEW